MLKDICAKKQSRRVVCVILRCQCLSPRKTVDVEVDLIIRLSYTISGPEADAGPPVRGYWRDCTEQTKTAATEAQTAQQTEQ